MNLYERLKAYGFSAAKSAEIVLDVKRGNRHALNVVAALGFPIEAVRRHA